MALEGRERVWAEWMTAALAGDEPAYHRLLAALAPVLCAYARRTLAQMGASTADAEVVPLRTASQDRATCSVKPAADRRQDGSYAAATP